MSIKIVFRPGYGRGQMAVIEKIAEKGHITTLDLTKACYAVTSRNASIKAREVNYFIRQSAMPDNDWITRVADGFGVAGSRAVKTAGANYDMMNCLHINDKKIREDALDDALCNVYCVDFSILSYVNNGKKRTLNERLRNYFFEYIAKRKSICELVVSKLPAEFDARYLENACNLPISIERSLVPFVAAIVERWPLECVKAMAYGGRAERLKKTAAGLWHVVELDPFLAVRMDGAIEGRDVQRARCASPHCEAAQ